MRRALVLVALACASAILVAVLVLLAGANTGMKESNRTC